MPWRILTAATVLFTAVVAQAADTTPDQANNKLIESRAVEAVLWGMPAVNYGLMLQEMLTKTKGKVGEVIYWGRPLDSSVLDLSPIKSAKAST